MRHLAISLILALCSFAVNASAQSGDKAIETLILTKLEETNNQLQAIKPRYKIYPTENVYISIKLDTATGKLWMIQIGLGDTYGGTVPIDETSLSGFSEEVRNGRFELYPTKNMYNFILLDTELGRTYQVQWSTEPDKRWRVRL